MSFEEPVQFQHRSLNQRPHQDHRILEPVPSRWEWYDTESGPSHNGLLTVNDDTHPSRPDISFVDSPTQTRSDAVGERISMICANQVKHCNLSGKGYVTEDLENALRLWSKPVVLMAARNLLERLPLNAPSTILCLDLSWNRLTSMEGFNVLHNLRELDVSHNLLTSTQGLASNTELRHLRMSHNEAHRVEALEQLKKLEEADLSHNLFSSSVDIRPLSLNAALRCLRMEGNPLCHRHPPRPPDSGGKSYRVGLQHLLPGVFLLDGQPRQPFPHSSSCAKGTRSSGSHLGSRGVGVCAGDGAGAGAAAGAGGGDRGGGARGRARVLGLGGAAPGDEFNRRDGWLLKSAPARRAQEDWFTHGGGGGGGGGGRRKGGPMDPGGSYAAMHKARGRKGAEDAGPGGAREARATVSHKGRRGGDWGSGAGPEAGSGAAAATAESGEGTGAAMCPVAGDGSGTPSFESHSLGTGRRNTRAAAWRRTQDSLALDDHEPTFGGGGLSPRGPMALHHRGAPNRGEMQGPGSAGKGGGGSQLAQPRVNVDSQKRCGQRGGGTMTVSGSLARACGSREGGRGAGSTKDEFTGYTSSGPRPASVGPGVFVRQGGGGSGSSSGGGGGGGGGTSRRGRGWATLFAAQAALSLHRRVASLSRHGRSSTSQQDHNQAYKSNAPQGQGGGGGGSQNPGGVALGSSATMHTNTTTPGPNSYHHPSPSPNPTFRTRAERSGGRGSIGARPGRAITSVARHRGRSMATVSSQRGSDAAATSGNSSGLGTATTRVHPHHHHPHHHHPHHHHPHPRLTTATTLATVNRPRGGGRGRAGAGAGAGAGVGGARGDRESPGRKEEGSQAFHFKVTLGQRCRRSGGRPVAPPSGPSTAREDAAPHKVIKADRAAASIGWVRSCKEVPGHDRTSGGSGEAAKEEHNHVSSGMYAASLKATGDVGRANGHSRGGGGGAVATGAGDLGVPMMSQAALWRLEQPFVPPLSPAGIKRRATTDGTKDSVPASSGFANGPGLSPSSAAFPEGNANWGVLDGDAPQLVGWGRASGQGSGRVQWEDQGQDLGQGPGQGHGWEIHHNDYHDHIAHEDIRPPSQGLTLPRSPPLSAASYGSPGHLPPKNWESYGSLGPGTHGMYSRAEEGGDGTPLGTWEGLWAAEGTDGSHKRGKELVNTAGDAQAGAGAGRGGNNRGTSTSWQHRGSSTNNNSSSSSSSNNSISQGWHRANKTGWVEGGHSWDSTLQDHPEEEGEGVDRTPYPNTHHTYPPGASSALPRAVKANRGWGGDATGVRMLGGLDQQSVLNVLTFMAERKRSTLKALGKWRGGENFGSLGVGGGVPPQQGGQVGSAFEGPRMAAR